MELLMSCNRIICQQLPNFNLNKNNVKREIMKCEMRLKFPNNFCLKFNMVVKTNRTNFFCYNVSQTERERNHRQKHTYTHSYFVRLYQHYIHSQYTPYQYTLTSDFDIENDGRHGLQSSEKHIT